jgi:hypothetical protein
MPDVVDTIEAARSSVERLEKRVSKSRTPEIRAAEELDLIRATALGWLRTSRLAVGNVQTEPLSATDTTFQELLELSAHRHPRARCKASLKRVKRSLVELRTHVLANPSAYVGSSTSIAPPDWSSLVSDVTMQRILSRRWNETIACMSGGAPLAATVMMGAILEALLLSRVNHMQDKSPVFKAKASPKDRKTGTVLPLQNWTLNNYIEVAHELQWIRQPARDVGVVLRDYRNFIHPAKELSEAISIEPEDCSMFWSVFTSLAQQILSRKP